MCKKIKSASHFFEQVNKELKKKGMAKNQKLDKLVSCLISEESNIMFLQTAIFKRARIYTELDAERRFLNPPSGVFKGYDKEGSFVNPKGCAVGRCNTNSVNCLYLANSIQCCISEVQPSIGSFVSVADIKAKEELRIIDLSKNYALSNTSETLVKGLSDSEVVLYLQLAFSKPHITDEDYLLTQYVSKKIHDQGFDGLSFYSSKYAHQNPIGIPQHGYNFVIFNFEKCEAISSKLYRIETVEYGLRAQA